MWANVAVFAQAGPCVKASAAAVLCFSPRECTTLGAASYRTHHEGHVEGEVAVPGR